MSINKIFCLLFFGSYDERNLSVPGPMVRIEVPPEAWVGLKRVGTIHFRRLIQRPPSSLKFLIANSLGGSETTFRSFIKLANDAVL